MYASEDSDAEKGDDWPRHVPGILVECLDLYHAFQSEDESLERRVFLVLNNDNDLRYSALYIFCECDKTV